MTNDRVIRIAVSGIPRGYHFPRADGNWLEKKHKEQILSISSAIELVETPAHTVNDVEGIEVLLAEGGNRAHYSGELDWEDYQKFFYTQPQMGATLQYRLWRQYHSSSSARDRDAHKRTWTTHYPHRRECYSRHTGSRQTPQTTKDRPEES